MKEVMNSRVTRAKGTSVLWRLTAAMLALFALTGAAFAQAGDATMLKEKDEAEGKAIEKYIDRMHTDEQYKKAIREQQAAPASSDPWGNVRATTTPANPAAKPAIKKPATKTASGAKSGAAGKPATGAFAPANSATQKTQ
jgi:hypothetical protein